MIQTENLTKIFGKVCAVNGLNLKVAEGTTYALVGPNGAGKTTLIKILMNIFEPTSGRAEVLGMDSTSITGRVFTNIGYVSENQDLPESMRVNEFFAYLRPFYPQWDVELEKELITSFALPASMKIKSLSRGVRMKVALASSMAYHPKLIVLDEPFSGLDPLVRDELGTVLLERASSATILISSHDLAEVETFASHVGYLQQGSLGISEEMSSLLKRFREVEVTCDPVPRSADSWPATWTGMAKSEHGIKFVETQFGTDKTDAAVRQAFSNVSDIKITPMSLRSIFVAIAKSERKTN